MTHANTAVEQAKEDIKRHLVAAREENERLRVRITRLEKELEYLVARKVGAPPTEESSPFMPETYDPNAGLLRLALNMERLLIMRKKFSTKLPASPK